MGNKASWSRKTLSMFGFEVRDRDLLARIGKLTTMSGAVETPAFLPVINPLKQAVTARELLNDFGCRMVITNSYIIKKQLGEAAKKKGIHSILDFPSVIMTDSGAYQILAYGRVGVTPDEIVQYQEKLGSDIATILDIPTGWRVTREQAQHTVEETIRRAKQLEGLKTREDVMWVGPVQGGRFLDLVAFSAQAMRKLPFEVHALGSPTPVMEQYLFDLLVSMVLTAKMNLPASRLFHLFGAGHPFMFALVVALGCDLFDSAAYALFAQENRYMTEHGTVRLERLKYLPCSCRVCSKKDPQDLMEMPDEERERELTRHNLDVCFSEMRRIKQAIAEGRLWEHLEMMTHGHPSLLQALKHLGKYADYIEENSPVSKRSGLFFYSSVDLVRPEVTRYRKRLLERYTLREGVKVLLLLPGLGHRHLRRTGSQNKALRAVCEKLKVERSEVNVCVYAPPFGVIPDELSDVYPLGQYEYAYPPDQETIEYMAVRIVEHIETMKYKSTMMVAESGTWQGKLANLCSCICREKGVTFESLI